MFLQVPLKRKFLFGVGPEAVWKKDAFAYITAPNNDQLFIIDTQVDAIVDSIKISLGGSGMSRRQDRPSMGVVRW